MDGSDIDDDILNEILHDAPSGGGKKKAKESKETVGDERERQPVKEEVKSATKVIAILLLYPLK